MRLSGKALACVMGRGDTWLRVTRAMGRTVHDGHVVTEVLHDVDLAAGGPANFVDVPGRASKSRATARLTLRDLRRLDRLLSAGTAVWVCENPRILEAAMDAGTREVMVCTAGNPVVVVTMLLDRLAADGAPLCYRGDFDWAGLGIANRIIGAYGAAPWRMGTIDYEAAIVAAGARMVELPALAGAAVVAVWDADLAPVMVRSGRGVHEELILEDLVADLI